MNNKRLEYLEKTIKLIDIASRIDNSLDNNESKYDNSRKKVKPKLNF